MSLVIQQLNNICKLVGENNMYDVVIIGAGVSGSACARELKYNLSICVVEKGRTCAVALQRQTVLLSIPELTVRPVHLWHG